MRPRVSRALAARASWSRGLSYLGRAPRTRRRGMWGSSTLAWAARGLCAPCVCSRGADGRDQEARMRASCRVEAVAAPSPDGDPRDLVVVVDSSQSSQEAAPARSA
eukprot:7966367-Alexandrium_andersonii.AAC.2